MNMVANLALCSASLWMELASVTRQISSLAPVNLAQRGLFLKLRMKSLMISQNLFLSMKPSSWCTKMTPSIMLIMRTEMVLGVQLYPSYIFVQQLISSTYMRVQFRQNRGRMAYAYNFFIFRHFAQQVHEPRLTFLQLQPIQPRCRDIIERENLWWQRFQMQFVIYEAVKNSFSAIASLIIFSITRDFLYFRLCCMEAIRAPALTFLWARNYRNLWRMVEQPRFRCLAIFLRFQWTLPWMLMVLSPSYYFCPLELFKTQLKILFICRSFYFVIRVLIFLYFFILRLRIF